MISHREHMMDAMNQLLLKMLVLAHLEGKCLHLYFVMAHILTGIHDKDVQRIRFLDSIEKSFFFIIYRTVMLAFTQILGSRITG